jgi:hypothetical protein
MDNNLCYGIRLWIQAVLWLKYKVKDSFKAMV